MTVKTKGLFSSLRLDWKTPKYLLEQLRAEFGDLFDPCPPNPEFDGLNIDWHSPAYCNPPYGREVSKWVAKALIESRKGATVIMLLAARTDTKWFHDFILPNAKEIRFLRGRLCFDDCGGSAPFPSMIVIFKGAK